MSNALDTTDQEQLRQWFLDASITLDEKFYDKSETVSGSGNFVIPCETKT